MTILKGITYFPKVEKKVVLCTECDGTGVVYEYDDYYGGIISGNMECPYCKGKGRLLRIRNINYETL
jgi:DnaJ-class molecular chaperone